MGAAKWYNKIMFRGTSKSAKGSNANTGGKSGRRFIGNHGSTRCGTEIWYPNRIMKRQQLKEYNRWIINDA